MGEFESHRATKREVYPVVSWPLIYVIFDILSRMKIVVIFHFLVSHKAIQEPLQQQ